jgi:multicomponent Na+:H+ antiporter subunit D
MISEAAGMQHLEVVWYLLAAASAGVFLHAGIKFPWFVFFQKDSGLRPDDPPWNMRAAMVFFAVVCIGLGIAPGPLYAILAHPVDFVPYVGSHVVFYLQLLLFSGLAFFLLLGWLKRTLTITLDVDWLYRRLGPALARSLDRSADVAWNGVVNATALGARGILEAVRRHHGPEGILARTWPTGSMAFWTTVMLTAYLVLSYL